MHAVAIAVMGDQIGPADLPADDAFLHILLRQGIRKFAADCFAYRQTTPTVNMSFMFKGIFVVFGILKQNPDALIKGRR